MINCEAQRMKALGQEIWYYENMEGGDGIALRRDVFEEEYCSTCHRIDGEGKTKGPDLSHTGSRLQEGYLREWVTDPEAFRPETIMPSVQANGNKLDDLVFYLMSLE
ncbi:MAG: cytochrome c [Candidatus Hydrogenedentota bacterium]